MEWLDLESTEDSVHDDDAAASSAMNDAETTVSFRNMSATPMHALSLSLG